MNDLFLLLIGCVAGAIPYLFVRNKQKSVIRLSVITVLVASVLLLAWAFWTEFPNLASLGFIVSCAVVGTISGGWLHLLFPSFLIAAILGITGFSQSSDQEFMLTGLIVVGIITYFLTSSKPVKNRIRMTFGLSIFSVLYFIASIILAPDYWYSSLLVGIISIWLISIPTTRKYLKECLVLACIGLFSYFSFVSYPRNYVRIGTAQLATHYLDKFEFVDSSGQRVEIDDNVVIIETWHKYCTVCFHLMQDFHPFFQELELKSGLKHYYVYVMDVQDTTDIFSNEQIPFEGQVLLIDANLNYYNELHMSGAPYLNVYSKNRYVGSISGYDKRYVNSYKREINRLLEEASILVSNPSPQGLTH